MHTCENMNVEIFFFILTALTKLFMTMYIFINYKKKTRKKYASTAVDTTACRYAKNLCLLFQLFFFLFRLDYLVRNKLTALMPLDCSSYFVSLFVFQQKCNKLGALPTLNHQKRNVSRGWWNRASTAAGYDQITHIAYWLVFESECFVDHLACFWFWTRWNWLD